MKFPNVVIVIGVGDVSVIVVGVVVVVVGEMSESTFGFGTNPKVTLLFLMMTADAGMIFSGKLKLWHQPKSSTLQKF